MTNGFDRSAFTAALRARAPLRERVGPEAPRVARLPGFACATLHEVCVEPPNSGLGFCAVMLARNSGTVIWIAGEEDLAWPRGHGLSPAHLILVRVSQAHDALWAAEAALCCPAVGGVLLSLRTGTVLEPAAVRRLHLAAGTGGALGLLLRSGEASEDLTMTDAVPRWRVAPSGTSRGLADPRWEVELLRARGRRAAGSWVVAWRAAAGELELDEEATAALGARE